MTEAVVIETAQCRICGKPLEDEDSIERGIGPICWKYQENNATINARLKTLEMDEPPDDYVVLEEAIQLCSELGIPISRLAKAIGGDRVKEEPLSPNFMPVYVGKRRMRWLPAGCLAEIPDLLREGSDAPRKKKKTKKKKVHTLKAETGIFSADTAEPDTKAIQELLVVDVSDEVVSKQYEVQLDYGNFVTGDIVGLREFKTAFRKEMGSPLKMNRKRSKAGGTWYEDIHGVKVLQAID